MFEKFEARFVRDTGTPPTQSPALTEPQRNAQLETFFSRFQGASFDEGLYRVMDAERFEMAEQFVALAFPHLAKRAVPVSYNWLGHIFTLDLARREGNEPLMLMFEPESEEVLDIPCGLAAFHDEELLNYPDEALREGLYANWLKAGGKAPALDECVGYNVPFFLNGSDEMNNLGLTDIHVYWYLTAQLIDRVRDLPLGTRIGKITIEDP